MLLITRNQRQKVGDPAFVTRILRHIKLYYSMEFYRLSDEELSRRIAHCLEVGREHGFTFERSLTMFTANMLRINPKFYEQSAIGKILADPSKPEHERLQSAVVDVTGRDWDEAEMQCDAEAYWKAIDNAANEEA